MLPGFREFTTAFYWRCFDVAKELLRALALGLGLDDEEFFLRFHSGVNNQLRLLHYPPVEAEKLAKGEVASEFLPTIFLFLSSIGNWYHDYNDYYDAIEGVEGGSNLLAIRFRNARALRLGHHNDALPRQQRRSTGRGPQPQGPLRRCDADGRCTGSERGRFADEVE